MEETIENQIRTSARKSNFELLRIICILLIIMHHYALSGCNELLFSNEISIKRMFVQFFFEGGKLGVNCFVLISGFFLVNLKFNWMKVLHILTQIWFFSIAGMLVCYFFFQQSFDILTIIKNLLPVSFEVFSFASTYVLLYILSPFVNQMIHNLDKKTHQKLLITGAVLWVVIPTFTTAAVGMNELIWFLYLYVVGAYIRLYQEDFKKSAKVYLLFSIVVYAGIYGSMLLMDYIGLYIDGIGTRASYFIGENKVPMFLCSIALFIGFMKLEIKQNRCINMLAKRTFGVYLCHALPCTFNIIWFTLLKTDYYLATEFYWLHAIIAVILIFTVGCIIDLIRYHLLEKPFFRLIQYLLNKIFTFSHKH